MYDLLTHAQRGVSEAWRQSQPHMTALVVDTQHTPQSRYASLNVESTGNQCLLADIPVFSAEQPPPRGNSFI